MSFRQGWRAFKRQYWGVEPKVDEVYEWDYDHPVDPFKIERKFTRVLALQRGFIQHQWWFSGSKSKPYVDSCEVGFFRFRWVLAESAQQNEDAARVGEQQNSAEG